MTAFNNLQSALNIAETGDQIWVADGSYSPTAALDPNEPRTATFSLMSGVAIYGGFRGRDELDPNNIFTGETSLSQRDPELNETILSGNIGDPNDPDDNSFHVVSAISTDATAI